MVWFGVIHQIIQRDAVLELCLLKLDELIDNLPGFVGAPGVGIINLTGALFNE